MATIRLTRGLEAIVDDEDCQTLSRLRWHARASHGGRKFYASRGVWDSQERKMRAVSMHRVILNAPPELSVDHINGDTLDNRRVNLRLCTHSQNLANSERQVGRASHFKGVIWQKRNRKWRADVRHNGRRFYLGLFTDEIEAALAYDAKARELFGDFARPNFPTNRIAA